VTSINNLKSDHKNARKRTDRSAKLIAESLQRYGAARSIVIDEDNRILAGNGTIEGAKQAGIKNVRVIETDGSEIIAVKRTGLTEDEKVGLALADNRTSDLSDWDAQMLQQLSEEHDIAPWFEQEDLAEIIGEVEQLPAEGNTDPDEVPEAPEDPITKPGDLWILGNHRLLCGDSTNPQHVERLMDDKKADMVFTDPPYGMNLDTDYSTIKGSAKAKIKGGGRTYAPVAGDNEDFTPDLINTIFASFADVPEIFIWGADYFSELLPERKDGSWIVWDKRGSEEADKIVGASFELCWSKAKHKREIARVKWIGAFGNPEARQRVHPTQKPTDLILWFFDRWGESSRLVVDLYLGSGSTLIACEKQRKACYGMEMSPAYCDVIVKRWEDFTGNKAILEESPEAF
jgi:DNA modification methylase